MKVRQVWFREELDEVPGILVLDEDEELEEDDWDEDDWDDDDEDDDDWDDDEDEDDWDEWEDEDDDDLDARRGGRPTWNRRAA